MANSRQSATIFSPSSKRPTKRTRSSITEHSFQGITPSPKGKKCHPCVRYKVSPMSQAAHHVSGRSDGTLGQVARPVNTSAFVGTNPTDESIVSDLPVVRQLFGNPMLCTLLTQRRRYF